MEPKNYLPQPPPGLIDPVFRSGTMTAVGIVLGFSLGFITTWAANPAPWQPIDALPTVPLLIGIVFQIVALARLLPTNSIEVRVYDSAMRLFLTGLIFTAVGVSLGIVADVFGQIDTAFRRNH